MLAEADRAWLHSQAESLDAGDAQADAVLPRLAGAGLFRVGVPTSLGGSGGSVWDAVEAVTGVAEHSLAAAFAFWGQRAFIGYLLQSPNEALRAQWLSALLAGETAGATGLSNAMKYLGGIEALAVRAQPWGRGQGWALAGQVPWCTNLRKTGFVAAVAVDLEGARPFVAALPSGRAGLARSEDLNLIALRGSNTAALTLRDLPLQRADLLHEDANVFLPQVRPAFLGLQCGLSIGLARASLTAAAERAGTGRSVLQAPLAEQRAALAQTVSALRTGLEVGHFLATPSALFRLRLDLADIVQRSVQLELQASGGRAYHRDQPLGFARRWREAAFIPIVTPSVTQLRGALAQAEA